MLKTHNRYPGLNCPHCKTRAVPRTSEQVTDLLKEIRYRCDNDSCGHIFVAHLSIVYTTMPSAMPRADVHIPLSRAPQARLAIGQGGVTPIAANDQADAAAD